MIRNAKVGEKIVVLDPYTLEPRTSGAIRFIVYHKKPYTWIEHSLFDFEQGNTGTIVAIRKGARNKCIVVAPDAPNEGRVDFRPLHLRRINGRQCSDPSPA